MKKLIKSTADNYRERIQRLALFDPLYLLQKKTKKDSKGRDIDYYGLGLLSLLFFFENMLMRNKKTGVRELATYLIEMTEMEIKFTKKEYEELSRTIVEVFRPTSGKRNSRKFYNWETRREDEVFYSILKASKSDTKTQTQYYTLDEDGLELIFATKEYFSEFQLSINQLVLRKQLEKGEFIGALRQIDEMHIDVETLRDRMIRIKHEIQRNIISNETYNRYKNMVEDINRRLEREEEEFGELQSFVRDTKEKLGYELKHEKEIKTYSLILRIDKELGIVHHQHQKLLEESILLKTSALESAQESLYYVGIDTFNFDQEILGKLMSHPLPLNISKTLIKPLLHIERVKTWSPFSVFSEQRVLKGNVEESNNSFLEIASDQMITREKQVVQQNFTKIMGHVLSIMEGENKITLKEIIYNISNSKEKEILNKRIFYDFWLILHQKSPVYIDKYNENQENIFAGVFEMLQDKVKAINLLERSEVVEGSERYSIKNMELILEEIEDGILTESSN